MVFPNPEAKPGGPSIGSELAFAPVLGRYLFLKEYNIVIIDARKLHFQGWSVGHKRWVLAMLEGHITSIQDQSCVGTSSHSCCCFLLRATRNMKAANLFLPVL